MSGCPGAAALCIPTGRPGNGIHGQQLWISPPTKTVIVRFSSYPVTGGPELNKAVLTGFDTIAKALSR